MGSASWVWATSEPTAWASQRARSLCSRQLQASVMAGRGAVWEGAGEGDRLVTGRKMTRPRQLQATVCAFQGGEDSVVHVHAHVHIHRSPSPPHHFCHTSSTLVPGVDPRRCLPVCLDLGTNNKALREHPAYKGLRCDQVWEACGRPEVNCGKKWCFYLLVHLLEPLRRSGERITLLWPFTLILVWLVPPSSACPLAGCPLRVALALHPSHLCGRFHHRMP